MTNPLVLVADDEPQMLELVARHLKMMNEPRLDVLEASDGEEAWKLAFERTPDLVVLDVMMPGMSGWEVCRKIRETVELAHTSVVMLTGIGENLNQMTSPLYGADEYIDKPFDFGELDAKVKKALAARASLRNAVPRATVNGVHGPAKAAKSGGAKAKAKAKAAASKPAAKVAKAVAKVAKAASQVAKATKTSAAKPAKKKAAAKPAKAPKMAAKPAKAAPKKAVKPAKKAAPKKPAKKLAKKPAPKPKKKSAKKKSAKKKR